MLYEVITEALMRDLSRQPGVVAIGETGLDYFRDFSPRDTQRRAFQLQLQVGIDSYNFV